MAGPAWSYRSDVWWAHVAAILAVAVGSVGVVAASGAVAAVEVAVATVVTAAGFKATGTQLAVVAVVLMVSVLGWRRAVEV